MLLLRGRGALLDGVRPVCFTAGVSSKRTTSAIDSAAARLRQMCAEAEEGSLLGSEDSLVAALGVSRSTVRQVARLLEREGMLRVRRGINGGYFVSRPDLSTVEAAVSSYLDTLDMDSEDVTVIASILWVEVMRKAASLRSDEASRFAKAFQKRVLSIRADAPFENILRIERESRAEIFRLTKARYIELIFQINIAFANRHFMPSGLADDTQMHSEFVEAWRKAKLMELGAILDRDPEMAVLAARHIRNLWHRRVWAQMRPQPDEAVADSGRSAA